MRSSSDTHMITVSSVIRKVSVWGASGFMVLVRWFFLRGKRLLRSGWRKEGLAVNKVFLYLQGVAGTSVCSAVFNLGVWLKQVGMGDMELNLRSLI